jgi:site-specific DNA-methyltransferase (adenine-specific)
MEFMAQFTDNYFELAIVDPPYGWGVGGVKGRNRSGSGDKWNIAPEQNYFTELMRVSKLQIIWGGNYFNLPPTRCMIVWDKKQPVKQFARCEIAWTNIDKNSEIFEYMYFGNINSENKRFHPTQKPVVLYEWLLKNYAKEGDKILDTHMGSQSSRIAAYKYGFDYWGSELDADYFKSGCERFERESKQPMLLKT